MSYIANNFMAFLMQRDIRDTNTNKFRHLSAKNNHKIEIPNINIVIRNEFGNVEKSKRVRAVDKLSIRFNGKELQILENGEITNKTFTISPFALSNPKELIKESRDYILDIKNIPAFITPDYTYILSMQDKNNNIATITNKNTKNIINAEIFLDDMFADFARILSNYKTAYNVSEVRVEVGYGSVDDIIFPLKVKPLNDKGLPYDWTIENPTDKKATQTIYGRSRKKGRKHAGRDLYTKPFAEVVAIANGTVLDKAYFYEGTYQVTVLHKSAKYDKFIVRYGELNGETILVKKGDIVKRGQVLGKTGKMNGIENYMLHFEFYVNGNRIDIRGRDILSRPNDIKNIFKRRDDITDPLEILLEGYKNTFKE